MWVLVDAPIDGVKDGDIVRSVWSSYPKGTTQAQINKHIVVPPPVQVNPRGHAYSLSFVIFRVVLIILLLFLVITTITMLIRVYSSTKTVCNGCLYYTGSKCTKYVKGRDALGSCATCLHPAYTHALSK